VNELTVFNFGENNIRIKHAVGITDSMMIKGYGHCSHPWRRSRNDRNQPIKHVLADYDRKLLKYNSLDIS
jgi:hypothetical protein